MTTGVLIFAFNNESVDYISMAAWSAANIHRHLGLPVCVVTDRPTPCDHVDQMIHLDPAPTDTLRSFDDLDHPVTWRNLDRVDAYRLSPWDRTLLLDADYVIASSQLKVLLDSHEDVLCHRLATTAAGSEDRMSGSITFGSARMPMWWATVMLFRRGERARMLFDVMHMVRQNWRHYCDLYGVGRSAYRNDFALTIALHVLSGHTGHTNAIPWSLSTVLPDQQLSQVDLDSYRVEWQESSGARRWSMLTGKDFHAMGKGQLGAIVANKS